MKLFTAIPNRFATFLFVLVLALSLTLAGCSGGGEEGGSGDSGDSGDSGGSSETTQDAGETTASGEDAAEETIAVPEQTQEGPSGPDVERTADPRGSTALAGGLEAARSEAESWNADAELYAIVSLQPTVNAEGRSRGWLYSFVSESESSIISIPYTNGELRNAQGQGLPEGQIQLILEDTLPVEEMIDSPEALERSDEVRSFLEENPQTGASVSADAASRNEEAQWILQVPQAGLQETVPATE